ncbi:MAG: type II toxin-antitoxin system RelE/ParE family toxin [Nitrospirae bacterium]|nr:type II toxin-antitoxin system RelE/ParE family toxin [Magnetococcales bacterium]HAT50871.1 type II toxin-antitoxin system mRNA interferase toxin, RelE/StbE family [Alphaproteobacteria bacterium]
MAYKVFIPGRVQKQIDKLPRNVWLRVRSVIDQLEDNPRSNRAKKLSGLPDTWRIRAGDYRILYSIEDDKLIVLVIKIGHRREIYR